ncbi:sialidase-1 [Arthrobacter stackebrandtii]|uniref:exo-alpha-sialidase n=1 Tax=Arthrobacter stackebrandtii TaxID=272161 RepID=A0ABS4YVZ6_9MICC|nr:exo-alpha-sialidase [Arthrobacter stackebrandtii]MBP2412991.1 sialidase-1 [Arthrobacter stackebrandtii]PYH01224.1 sialidase [Arthrobacter stackebrandtii]
MKSTDLQRRWKKRRTALAAGAIAAGMLATLAAPAIADVQPSAAASYEEQVLAKNGDNAIDPVLGRYYRIPALAHLGDGVVLASYDGRPDGGDSPSPNSIIQRRSTDNGKTWGAPTYVAKGQPAAEGKLRYGFSDPSYVVDDVTGDVFNFFVYSKDVSFQGSGYGNNDADRNITSAAVAVSRDKGLTWSMDPANMPVLPPVDYAAGSAFAGYDGPLVTDVAKPVGDSANVGGVQGVFAASGQGIQLKYGEYAGRLIQQFTGKVRQANGNVEYQAYSVYSDDHGKTWQRGEFTGTGMDENKTVELSNGDVMLNSRASSGGNGGRKVAISKDGGHSYGPVTVDTRLTDPVNNASIARMHPDAAEGSDEAKMLLFSNANATSRSNGTIRYSCNDGATWSAGKQFKSGSMSYSTVTALGDGTFGLFYEGDSNTMTFAKFNAEWLDIECGVELTAKAVTGANGETVQAELTLANNGKTTIAGAKATFAAQNAWTFGTADFADVAAGSSATVTVPVTIPASAKAGSYKITAKASYGTREFSAVVPVTVTGGAGAMLGLDVAGSRTDVSRDLAATPYTVGEQVPYQFKVTSLSNISSNVAPTAGNFNPFLPPAGGNCRWNNLSMWADYTCGTPRHAVTADELANGFFVPQTTWQAAASGMETLVLDVTGDEVDLLVRNPELTATAAAVWNDVDGNGLAGAGDTVTTTATVTNSGNVALTGVAGLGAEPATLAVGESASFTETRELTTAEIAAGAVAERSVSIAAANGAKDASAVAQTAAVELPVQPATPEEPAFEPSVERANLKGQAPVDLGLKVGKYSVGEMVTVKNLPVNEWAYVHLNQHGARIGWFLANDEGTITFEVPEGTKNGKDTLVVSGQDGKFLSFATFHTTPK